MPPGSVRHDTVQTRSPREGQPPLRLSRPLRPRRALAIGAAAVIAVTGTMAAATAAIAAPSQPGQHATRATHAATAADVSTAGSTADSSQAATAAGAARTGAARAGAVPALPKGEQRMCAMSTTPGVMSCLGVVNTIIRPLPHLASGQAPAGYGPSDLQSAYNLPSSSAGSGQTVAVVDAYDDPNAESDLATYRAQYGLPACTTANGCFRKTSQTGGSRYPSANSGWAEEESLDVDMVSAICPNCHVLLVEAKSPTVANLGTAVNEAVSLGAKYVSNSYGGSESSSETGSDGYYNHPGVAVTASAGDSGYGVSYPAASRYVTAVGGTSLNRDSSTSRGWSETVWGSPAGGEGTGSGCSAYEPKPSWQTDTGCSNRTGNDVAAVADPNTGVAIYDTYQQSGWAEVGGTSASSPIVASVYALAASPGSGVPAQIAYGKPSGLNDVTSGSDGLCLNYLCTAGTGYDGPTGLGTPNGLTAFGG